MELAKVELIICVYELEKFYFESKKQEIKVYNLIENQDYLPVAYSEF